MNEGMESGEIRIKVVTNRSQTDMGDLFLYI